MRKTKLIFYGLCLLLEGAVLELLKWTLKRRTERRIKKQKCISDFISIMLSERTYKHKLIWKKLEEKYLSALMLI